jgi:hypothetical protein
LLKVFLLLELIQALELKKTFDEKTAAISSKNAVELTLRRIYASQKDPSLPPLEQIIAPLEAEVKLKTKEVKSTWFSHLWLVGGSSVVCRHLNCPRAAQCTNALFPGSCVNVLRLQKSSQHICKFAEEFLKTLPF